MAKYLTSRGERGAYGGYFAGQNLILMIVLQFLMIFYTDVVGLPAAAIGTMFLVARVWDAINDPIMGIIVDRVTLKGGKFKPWINMVIFLLPIATILLFQNVGATMETKMAYAYVTYILWGMIYTVSDIPIFALATVMSDQVDERVNIISIGRLAAGIGALLGVVIITPLVMKFSWSVAIIIVSVFALLIMLPVKYKTVERVIYNRDKSFSIGNMLNSVIRNKFLLIFYAVVILTNITNSGSATIIYFVKYNLNNELLIPVISIAAALSSLILPFFLPRMIRKIGKRKLFLSFMILSIASSIIFYFIGYDNMVVVFIFIALKYIGLNLPILMMGMFTSDCLEYDYFNSGNRNEGIVFSVQTFSIKLTLALQGAIGAFALGLVKYVPNEPQTAEALDGIWKMNTIYPVVGQIIAMVVFYYMYKLSEADVERMINSDGKQQNKIETAG